MPSPLPIIHSPSEGGGADLVIDPQPPVVAHNTSTGNQVLTASVANYINGSRLLIPRTRRLGLHAVMRWSVVITKTAAGTAETSAAVALGVNGSASDTPVLVAGLGLGTAAADVGQLDVTVVVRPGSILYGAFRVTHSLATTGLIVVPTILVPAVSTALDLTVESLYAGLVISPGASVVATVSLVEGEVRLPLEMPL